jgi:hypothetical protein
MYQNVPYNLEPLPFLRDFLEKLEVLSEKEWYERSYQILPKVPAPPACASSACLFICVCSPRRAPAPRRRRGRTSAAASVPRLRLLVPRSRTWRLLEYASLSFHTHAGTHAGTHTHIYISFALLLLPLSAFLIAVPLTVTGKVRGARGGAAADRSFCQFARHCRQGV